MINFTYLLINSKPEDKIRISQQQQMLVKYAGGW